MQPSSPFRVHTYLYVARAKVTVSRRFFQYHVIQDEHISCGYADAMTSHFSSRLTRIPACREVRLRHIHVNNLALHEDTCTFMIFFLISNFTMIAFVTNVTDVTLHFPKPYVTHMWGNVRWTHRMWGWNSHYHTDLCRSKYLREVKCTWILI